MRALLLALVIVLGYPAQARADCDIAQPVGAAAVDALRTGDLSLVAIWVKQPKEAALRAALQHALAVRRLGTNARTLADGYFCDTVIRLHRESYPGVRDRVVEQTIASGDLDLVVERVLAKVQLSLRERARDIAARKPSRRGDIDGGRAYVERYTDFVEYVTALDAAATKRPTPIADPIRHEP